MWSDLVNIFSGWYQSYVSSVKSLLEYSNTDADGVVTTVVPVIWSAFVPWEEIIACVVLCIFVVSIFRFLRSVLCKML